MLQSKKEKNLFSFHRCASIPRKLVTKNECMFNVQCSRCQFKQIIKWTVFKIEISKHENLLKMNVKKTNTFPANDKRFGKARMFMVSFIIIKLVVVSISNRLWSTNAFIHKLMKIKECEKRQNKLHTNTLVKWWAQCTLWRSINTYKNASRAKQEPLIRFRLIVCILLMFSIRLKDLHHFQFTCTRLYSVHYVHNAHHQHDHE